MLGLILLLFLVPSKAELRKGEGEGLFSEKGKEGFEGCVDCGSGCDIFFRREL
jgi:hypothetical protein